MILKISDDEFAASVRKFKNHEYIDGGDTVVLRFQGADDQSFSLIVPRKELYEAIEKLSFNKNIEYIIIRNISNNSVSF